MSCPRCSLRLFRSSKRARTSLPTHRTFHTSPTHSRLGASTYAQEWQTGTYHFNKALTKTLPVASTHTDHLLTAWATQQHKKRSGSSGDSAGANQLVRNSIAAQRRKSDNVLISHSTAKDFGNRVEVTAFVFDGKEAALKEEERRK
ncbi:hypothetical protein LTR37_019796, partial [Vermiconidia calcicola]